MAAPGAGLLTLEPGRVLAELFALEAGVARKLAEETLILDRA